MRFSILTLVVSAAALAGDTGSTTLETQSTVPIEQDGCLDHAVKELGMSAKRVEGERRWTIGPQFLHPSIVQGGTLGVRLEKGEKLSTVRVTATWPGAPKAKDLQPELESRVTAMASKIAQVCGVTQPSVKCEVKDAAGKATSCAAR